MYRGRNILVHQQTATTTPAVVGLSGDFISVIIQNDPDSTPDIKLGNATNQYLVLEPGKSITLTMEDCTRLYVKSASDTATVNILAVR